MKKKNRSRAAMPFVPEASANPNLRAEPKLLSVMNRTTAALRSRSRRFWGKPKPFEVSDLQAGDLAFSRFKSKTSDSISSMITGFPPMHVSLYVGDGKFFDLSERAKIVLSETLCNYYPAPFIFRSKLSPEQKEKIVFLTKQMANAKVRRGKRIRPVIGVQRTVGIKVKRPKDRGYLCSNALAEIFQKAGVTLVPGVHPLRVSPTDLLKSKKLELING